VSRKPWQIATPTYGYEDKSFERDRRRFDLDDEDAASDCVFCKIVRREAPAQITAETDYVIAIIPLNPVVPGHRLVIPKLHVESAVTNPAMTGTVMVHAAALAQYAGQPCNIITSVGAEATQTVFHLHIHVVPRRAGDGLPLPWTPQQEAAARG
jgi:histidine triad (HIT) family protein